MKALLKSCWLPVLLASCHTPFEPQHHDVPDRAEAGVAAAAGAAERPILDRTPRWSRLTLDGLSDKSAIPKERLESLAEELNIDVSLWESSFSSGYWPGGHEQVLSRQALEKAAGIAADRLSREELVALIEGIGGRSLGELRSWFKQHGGRIRWNQDGTIALAQVFELLRAVNAGRDPEAGGEMPPFLEQPEQTGTIVHVEDRPVLFNAGDQRSVQEQGWLYFANPESGAAVLTNQPSAAVLDTTADSAIRAGMFSGDPFGVFRHPRLPELDAEEGFVIRSIVKLETERHLKDNRSGAVILVADKNLNAVEVGLWVDSAWVQPDSGNPLFEGAVMNEVRLDFSDWVSFDIFVSGDRFALLANERVLVKGDLKDYSSAGPEVYRIPSFLFLGDNTSSASARLHIAQVEVWDTDSYLAQMASVQQVLAGLGWPGGVSQGVPTGPSIGFSPPGNAPPAYTPPPEQTEPQVKFSVPNKPARSETLRR